MRKEAGSSVPGSRLRAGMVMATGEWCGAIPLLKENQKDGD